MVLPDFMMKNRTALQTLIWATVLLLCGMTAGAQEQAPSNSYAANSPNRNDIFTTQKAINIESNPVKGFIFIPVQSETYNGHDYSYYKQEYILARKQMRAGGVLTAFGFLLSTGSLFVNSDAGVYMFYGGAFLFSVGMPVWISGIVKTENNSKAMQMTKSGATLSLSTTQNGIGLVFSF